MRLIALLAILGLLNSVVGLVKYQPEAVHISYGGMSILLNNFICTAVTAICEFHALRVINKLSHLYKLSTWFDFIIINVQLFRGYS